MKQFFSIFVLLFFENISYASGEVEREISSPYHSISSYYSTCYIPTDEDYKDCSPLIRAAIVNNGSFLLKEYKGSEKRGIIDSLSHVKDENIGTIKVIADNHDIFLKEAFGLSLNCRRELLTGIAQVKPEVVEAIAHIYRDLKKRDMDIWWIRSSVEELLPLEVEHIEGIRNLLPLFLRDIDIESYQYYYIIKGLPRFSLERLTLISYYFYFFIPDPTRYSINRPLEELWPVLEKASDKVIEFVGKMGWDKKHMLSGKPMLKGYQFALKMLQGNLESLQAIERYAPLLFWEGKIHGYHLTFLRNAPPPLIQAIAENARVLLKNYFLTGVKNYQFDFSTLEILTGHNKGLIFEGVGFKAKDSPSFSPKAIHSLAKYFEDFAHYLKNLSFLLPRMSVWSPEKVEAFGKHLMGFAPQRLSYSSQVGLIDFIGEVDNKKIPVLSKTFETFFDPWGLDTKEIKEALQELQRYRSAEIRGLAKKVSKPYSLWGSKLVHVSWSYRTTAKSEGNSIDKWKKNLRKNLKVLRQERLLEVQHKAKKKKGQPQKKRKNRKKKKNHEVYRG